MSLWLDSIIVLTIIAVMVGMAVIVYTNLHDGCTSIETVRSVLIPEYEADVGMCMSETFVRAMS